MEFNLNIWALLTAFVLHEVLGGLWYSKLFREPWMRLAGVTPDGTKGAGKALAQNAVASLILTYVLALFINLAGPTTALEGAEVGFFLWIGFVAPILAAEVFFVGKPWKLFWINAGYRLVAMVLMSVLLALWV